MKYDDFSYREAVQEFLEWNEIDDFNKPGLKAIKENIFDAEKYMVEWENKRRNKKKLKKDGREHDNFNFTRKCKK